jgi:putative transposase
MTKSRFSEEQIIGVLREQENGAMTEEVYQRHGICTTTFYKWRARYGGLEVSEARRLKALEDENRRLQKLLAEAVLDMAALKDLLAKMNGPPRLPGHTALPGPGRGRRLHPRALGRGRRHVDLEHAGRARAGYAGRPTPRPDDDRQRQRPGADLTCDPGVDQSCRPRLALHRARQAAADARSACSSPKSG